MRARKSDIAAVKKPVEANKPTAKDVSLKRIEETLGALVLSSTSDEILALLGLIYKQLDSLVKLESKPPIPPAHYDFTINRNHSGQIENVSAKPKKRLVN